MSGTTWKKRDVSRWRSVRLVFVLVGAGLLTSPSPGLAAPVDNYAVGANPTALALKSTQLLVLNQPSSSNSNLSDFLTKVDLGTGSIGSPVTSDHSFHSLVANPLGDHAYVIGRARAYGAGQQLARINLSSNSIVDSLVFPAYDYSCPCWTNTGLQDLAIDPTGSNAYLLTREGPGDSPRFSRLIKVDLASFAISATTTIPFANPYSVALDPSGDSAYVSDWVAGKLAKINTLTSSVVQTLQVDLSSTNVGAYGIAVHPTGSHAFVVTDNASIAKVDLEPFSLVGEYPGGGNARSVVLSPSGDFLYTDSPYGDHPHSIAKIRTNTMGTVAWIPVGYIYGNNSRNLAVDPTGSYLYAAKYFTGTVARVDLAPAPTAALTSAVPTPEKLSPVTLDASSSEALWGEPRTFAWDLDGNGTFETDSGSTPTVSKAFESLGEKVVGVRVSAPTGVDTATTEVTVVPDNIVAEVSGPSTPVATEESVTFNAGQSEADSGAISRYEWDLKGDGTFTPGESTASTSFGERGTKTISVRVTSRGGESAVASTTVDVRQAPPPGEIGISVNNGDIATNSPKVKLRLVWPRLVSNALISNDGGFVPSETVPVEQQISWTLRSSGPERQPRIVYVRFRGWEDSALTFTDDIILDERPPEVVEASGLAGPSTSTRTLRKPKARVVRVQARDSNSGVATVSVSRKPRGKAVVTKRLVGRGRLGKRKQETTIKVPKSLKRAFIRVNDVAGNSSKPLKVTR